MSTPSVTGRITMLRSNPDSPKLTGVNKTETNRNNDFSDDDEEHLEKTEMNDNKFDERGNSNTEEIGFEESTNVEDENGKERNHLFRDSNYEIIITELEQFAKSEDKKRWSYICSDSDDDDDEGDDDEIGDERHQDDVKGQELDDSNDSDFYDTDLDDLSPENNRAGNINIKVTERVILTCYHKFKINLY